MYIPSGRVLVMLALSLMMFMATLSTGDGFPERKETRSQIIDGQQRTNEHKWTKSSATGANSKKEIPSHHKNVNGAKFRIKQFNDNLLLTPLRRATKGANLSRTGSRRSKTANGRYTFSASVYAH